FAPDGKTLAVGNGDWDAVVTGEVTLWDVGRHEGKVTLTERQRFKANKGGVFCLAFDPRGRYLATGGRDQVVRLWHPATGKPVRALPGHTGVVNGVSFSADGSLLASGGYDQTVRLWDPDREGGGQLLPGPTNGIVFGVAFSPRDGTLAAVTGVPHGGVALLCLWDARTRAFLGKCCTGEFHAYALAFAPDGQHVFTGDAHGILRRWDVSTRYMKGALPDLPGNSLTAVAVSPHRRGLATGGPDRRGGAR